MSCGILGKILTVVNHKFRWMHGGREERDGDGISALILPLL